MVPPFVTKSPAASDTTSAGICVTNPSPIVNTVYLLMASPMLSPWLIIPIRIPPNTLTNVMMRPATASPRTNFDAPSMAPKKELSSSTILRRPFASSSVMAPAPRSASMAICLPGIASSENRAATSAILVEPLVITIKLIRTRMVKTIIPIMKSPPRINWANPSITFPAAPGPL